MSGLKALRNRLKTVVATKKITSAMKMVAAAKLRRASDVAIMARPYAEGMHQLVHDAISAVADEPLNHPLLQGNPGARTVLFVVISSDRGLCGSYNSSIIRRARAEANAVRSAGGDVRFICLGRKALDAMNREFPGMVVALETLDKPTSVVRSQQVMAWIAAACDRGDIQRVSLISAFFRSPMSQPLQVQTLVPFPVDAAVQPRIFDFEPDHAALLDVLLQQALATKIYQALLENMASEQGARMVAMDNATRNADEMKSKLQLAYNRTRQANITKELIEIISGAENL